MFQWWYSWLIGDKLGRGWHNYMDHYASSGVRDDVFHVHAIFIL